MEMLRSPCTYEYDGRDVDVPSKHPLYRYGQRRSRYREFVFTRKDDAIFEAALRAKYPAIEIFLKHEKPTVSFERVDDIYADNRRGSRWIVLPDEPNWRPLVVVTSRPDYPMPETRLHNLPGRWLRYSRSHWMWPWDGIIGKPTSFDWPYLTGGAIVGQIWDLDPDLERVKSFYRTAMRIVSRIATDRAKHGTRLMNELNGGDHKRMAELERCRCWFGHSALEWSRAGGDRKMLNSFYRPADDWDIPADPWYRRLRAEAESRYGAEFGLPPETRPDDGEHSTP